MMQKEQSIESVLPDIDRKRILKYRTLAMAFCYPDDSFFVFFPQLSSKKEYLLSEYDRLFRASEVWLYGTEYLAENEFQRVNLLADISGFYRAFGLEPDRDRPDLLASELEFMYYLILKRLHAFENGEREKALICLDAQKKFFTEHLCPAATKIAEAIISQGQNNFYIGIADELLEFLESEKRFFGGNS